MKKNRYGWPLGKRWNYIYLPRHISGGLFSSEAERSTDLIATDEVYRTGGAVMNWVDVNTELPDDDIEVLVYHGVLNIFHLAHHEGSEWISEDGDTLLGITRWLEVIPPEVKP